MDPPFHEEKSRRVRTPEAVRNIGKPKTETRTGKRLPMYSSIQRAIHSGASSRLRYNHDRPHRSLVDWIKPYLHKRKVVLEKKVH